MLLISRWQSGAVKILERRFESSGDDVFLDIRKRGEDNVYITVTEVACLKILAIQITLLVT